MRVSRHARTHAVLIGGLLFDHEKGSSDRLGGVVMGGFDFDGGLTTVLASGLVWSSDALWTVKGDHLF